MPRRTPPEASVPHAEADPPRFGRLALIVLCCFGAGIGWPLLGGGLDFVQRPPGSVPSKAEDANPPAPDADPELKPSQTPKPTPGVAAPPGDGARAAAHLAPLPPLSAERPSERTPSAPGALFARSEGSVVSSCRDGSRTLSGGSCDTPSLEGSFATAFGNLGRCTAAQGAVGVLSLGLDLDFAQGRVTGVRAGQSTTLPRDSANALLACAKKKLLGAALERVQHLHQAYSVYYQLRLSTPGSTSRATPRSPPSTLVAASGQATIASKSALLRDGPSLDAEVLQKLQYGVRVSVTGRRGDWYRIAYDGHGATGWVHRKALGL